MRLFKPPWVSHSGKPLFSIDIHPDGTRFATGGQGDNSGKVVIWNMTPVVKETAELDNSIPKMLCQMDNHLACVNCVRWSRGGKYLASGGDDRLVMIWQFSRMQGTASAFGGSELWRACHILRGHTGDILDLSWSPNDQWLASCSVDNSVVIWNAQKFPEQAAVLKGHVGMVKGITWDPVGKYVASQSDDKTLRVWRTLDWQEEACVKDPFKECAGVTHVLRLEWSPDGQYIMSAHATNNGWPTTQIVERNGWRATLDFVGHRKAVTCVRFSPRIFTKTVSKNEKNRSEQYMCCALGSRDRSLSFWLTCLKRPLAVIHDLFKDTTIDISWHSSGFQLLCCSTDGTVAFVDFSDEEIGKPMTNDQMVSLYQQLYGSSMLMPGARSQSALIIETAAVMDLQQQKTAIKNTSLSMLKEGDNKVIVNGENKSEAAAADSSQQVLTNGDLTPSKALPNLGKQIETRTKDGKRRITPILLSATGDFATVSGEAVRTFTSPVNQGPVFSSSTEHSKIIIDKSNSHGSEEPADKISPAKLVFPIEKPQEPSVATVTPVVPVSSTEVPKQFESKSLHERMIGSSIAKAALAKKRKLPILSQLTKGNRGRPRKERVEERNVPNLSSTTEPAHHDTKAQQPEGGAVISSNVASHKGSLPVAHLQTPASLQLETRDADGYGVIDVENNLVLCGSRAHRLSYKRAGQSLWYTLLAHPVAACVANRHLVFVACEDGSVSVLTTTNGCRQWPPMVLDSRISTLQCGSQYVAAITSHAFLYVWNVSSKCATVKKESLLPILHGADVRIDRFMLTDQGVVGVSLSNGCSFTYSTDLCCWLQIRDASSLIERCSDFRNWCGPTSKGTLALLSQPVPGVKLPLLVKSAAESHMQQTATTTHMEMELLSALALQSSSEYHNLLLSFVRHLTSTGNEIKLRYVCNQLLVRKFSKESYAASNMLLGMKKDDLLREILPIIGSNLALQRLYTEFHDQLNVS